MVEQDIIRQMNEPSSANFNDGEAETNWFLLFFDQGPMSAEEVIAAFDTSLNAVTLVIFLTASMSSALLATVVPILYIMRLDPKKILM